MIPLLSLCHKAEGTRFADRRLIEQAACRPNVPLLSKCEYTALTAILLRSVSFLCKYYTQKVQTALPAMRRPARRFAV